MRALLIFSILWFLGVWATFIFFFDLADALWIAMLPLKLLLLIIGVALAIIAVKNRRQRHAKASLLIVGIGLLAYFTFGFTAGQRIRFAWLRPKYEARLQVILATIGTNASSGAVAQFQDCVIDQGPPIRVAFYWHRGAVDNWVGLVYDPTGAVLKANQFKGGKSSHAKGPFDFRLVTGHRRVRFRTHDDHVRRTAPAASG